MKNEYLTEKQKQYLDVELTNRLPDIKGQFKEEFLNIYDTINIGEELKGHYWSRKSNSIFEQWTRLSNMMGKMNFLVMKYYYEGIEYMNIKDIVIPKEYEDTMLSRIEIAFFRTDKEVPTLDGTEGEE